MATNNPLEKTYSSSLTVSSTVYSIAGILTTVYGLQELPLDVQEIAVLWLLHPRLQTHASMSPIAAQTVQHWNSRRGSSRKGLIAVSFDQRNHGSRLIDKLANEAWRQNNPRHAQDMYSIYHGTAVDTSLLLSHLPSYLPAHLPTPDEHIVLGISLGGHAAWHCLLHDPRITAGVVIIGCPDFTRLMLQRAEKSRLTTFGPKFLGSINFPPALLAEVRKTDPAGLLLPTNWQAYATVNDVVPSSSRTRDQIRELLHLRLADKKILNLSGGADKLVPYAQSEIFLRFIKAAIEPGEGWWKNNHVVLDDRIFDGVGHETTREMADVAVSFVGDVLAGEVKQQQSSGTRGSKM
jgi:pimeloyl-ACP methyl ester carboxylesterase